MHHKQAFSTLSDNEIVLCLFARLQQKTISMKIKNWKCYNSIGLDSVPLSNFNLKFLSKPKSIIL